jgi:hypothetical protein
MSETKWSDKRLRRLFERYNRKFFGNGLSGWTVGCGRRDLAFLRARSSEALRPGECFSGFCNSKARRISIDIDLCDSDYEVRRTLMHEMCHAATADENHFGDGEWFREMQRLRRDGAPAQCPLRYLRSLRPRVTTISATVRFPAV